MGALWTAGKRKLRYRKHTKHLCLVYRADGKWATITALADADLGQECPVANPSVKVRCCVEGDDKLEIQAAEYCCTQFH